VLIIVVLAVLIETTLLFW